MVFLFLSGEVYYVVVIEVDERILYAAVRSGDEAELVDSCVNAERRDKTDVRTLRALNRAKTSVVCIVYVSHLEACTLT